MLLRQSIDYYKYSALCCLLFIHGLCKYQSSNIRVMCKNIFYLICIQIEIANKDTLIKKNIQVNMVSIQKIIIINKNGYLKNESDYPTYSSYITYSSEIEASLALLALNNSINIATLFSNGQNALIKTIIILMKLLIKMILLIKMNPKLSSNSLGNKNLSTKIG